MFKRGDFVAWSTGGVMPATGTVLDVHTLGGHGRAYEIRVTGEALPEEIRECELWLASRCDVA